MPQGLSNEGFLIEQMLMVANKDREDVPFVLNEAQRRLDTNLSGRDLVPKARQRGVSTYFLARYFIACLSQRNVKAVVVSHETEATQRMLAKIRYFIEHFRGPQPEISNLSAHRIAFPKMNSEFFIGTAGATAFGRGDTISHLLCSEYAFWPNPLDLLTGLLQAVPKGGEIAIESTGNGSGNDYHKKCQRAYERAGAWKLHFLPWVDEESYRNDLTLEEEAYLQATIDPEMEEDKAIEYLDLGQLAWRRDKIEELTGNLPKFKQEYPISLDECFQASGKGIFSRVNYIVSPRWKRAIDSQSVTPEDPFLWILEGHPVGAYHYILGADVSAGVGSDRSTMEVFCVETNEQVAEWINDRTAPDTFADRIRAVGEHFHFPYVSVESNNHGILTLSKLSDIYPDQYIHRAVSAAPMDEIPKILTLGSRITERTKPLYIGKLRSLIWNQLKIYSSALKDELSTFVELDGKMKAQEGCHDDLVMAGAQCGAAWDQGAMVPRGQQIIDGTVRHDPFSLEAIIEERHRVGQELGQFPIASFLEY